MSKERNLWALLRDKIKEVHWQRIETGITGSGIPDVNGCAKGKEFWIELKEVHSGNSLTLRPMQVAWLSKRAMNGGQVFVLARKNNQMKLYHIDGIERAQELVKNGYKSDNLLTLDIPYEWEALYTALLS